MHGTYTLSYTGTGRGGGIQEIILNSSASYKYMANDNNYEAVMIVELVLLSDTVSGWYGKQCI